MSKSKKSAILETATRLFAQNGFRDTSMADLARSTGAAGSTILYHYKNKEELFLAVLEEVKDSILAAYRNDFHSRNHPNGLEAAQGGVAFYLHLAATMENRFLLLHSHEPHRLARVNPVCRRCLESLFSSLLDIFEQAIRMGQSDGSIRQMPARKAAMLLFTMADGIVRLHTFQLYDAGALYRELMTACRRILQAETEAKPA